MPSPRLGSRSPRAAGEDRQLIRVAMLAVRASIDGSTTRRTDRRQAVTERRRAPRAGRSALSAQAVGDFVDEARPARCGPRPRLDRSSAQSTSGLSRRALAATDREIDSLAPILRHRDASSAGARAATPGRARQRAPRLRNDRDRLPRCRRRDRLRWRTLGRPAKSDRRGMMAVGAEERTRRQVRQLVEQLRLPRRPVEAVLRLRRVRGSQPRRRGRQGVFVGRIHRTALAASARRPSSHGDFSVIDKDSRPLRRAPGSR